MDKEKRQKAEQEWNEWRGGAKTQEFFEYLADFQKSIKETWADMILAAPNPEREKDMRRQYEWLSEIIALEYEDIHNFYEGEL